MHQPTRIRLTGSARPATVLVDGVECGGLAAVLVTAAIQRWRSEPNGQPTISWDDALALAQAFDIASSVDDAKRLQNAWSPFAKRVGLDPSCKRGEPFVLALDCDWRYDVDVLRAEAIHEVAFARRSAPTTTMPTQLEWLADASTADLELTVLEDLGWSVGRAPVVPDGSVLWYTPELLEAVSARLLDAVVRRTRDIESQMGPKSASEWLRTVGERGELVVAGAGISELERVFDATRQRVARIVERAGSIFAVGVDAGGTRTTVALSCPAVADVEFTVPLPLATARGFAQMRADVDAVVSVIAERMMQLYWQPGTPVAMVIGAAGYSESTAGELLPMFRSALNVHRFAGTALLVNDIWTPILVSPGGEGVATVAGTGSVVASRRLVNGSYQSARLDGEEWVISDRGSGFQVAKQALTIALAHQQRISCGLVDRDDDLTALLHALCDHYGFDDLARLGRHFADPQAGFSKTVIASGAKTVSQLAEGGNTAARSVLAETGGYLGGLAHELLSQWGEGETPVLCSTGSVIANSTAFRDAFFGAATAAPLACTPNVQPVAHDGSASARDFALMLSAETDGNAVKMMLDGVGHHLLRVGLPDA
ncbi:MAG: BadF/BadG/BcrA/BcrD ATPase family protein [Acidimicrobiia bacterium]